MALKATLSVLFGCNFAQASRLLAAAERGEEKVVQQVLGDKPQLAAFAGFHGTTSPLHRAAVAGHLEVCRSIVEPLRQRIRVAEAAAAGGKRASAVAAVKWRKLLATVLNQRSHKSLTPLMLACEHGHASVVAYLLREGADPLATDFVHSRTCLHYAAVGGHADCLRLLCSDSALVANQDGTRPLRDVIVNDVQVQACRYVDQRAFGGLTALHFAVVTGNLDAVQALLRAGASIMVKSDGEAYIGDDFLVPGSTPLHVAVIINNISIVHAILQAHMEMMNILGTRLDERGRRPWEGTSRTDIRSVRNHFRKLPFHLARERQQPQLMGLVDPRIPVDVALDAARDTEHGIGPKRLGTICSLVLQRSLMQWLDDCQSELAREAAAQQLAAAACGVNEAELAAADQQQPLGRQQSAIQAALAAVTGRQRQGSSKPRRISKGGGSGPAGAVSLGAASPTNAGGYLGLDSRCQPSPSPTTSGLAQEAEHDVDTPRTGDAAYGVGGGGATMASPFAAMTQGLASAESSQHRGPSGYAASAPVTPARDTGMLGQQAPGPATVGAVPALAADQQGDGSLHRMASLHVYMGLLSLKRSQHPRTSDAVQAQYPGNERSVERAVGRRSGALTRQLLRTSSSAASAAAQAAQTARVRFLTDPTGGAADSGPNSPHYMGGADEELQMSMSPGGGLLQADRTITVLPLQRRTSSQGNMLGSMFVGLRDRLRSGDLSPPAPDMLGSGTGSAGAAAAPLAASLLLGDKHSEKDLGLDSEGEPPTPSNASEVDAEDVECGVCLDAAVEVAFAACQHKLCLECARNLTRQDKKPPHCPFCRRLVVGFQRVSVGGATASRCTSPEQRSSSAISVPVMLLRQVAC